MAQNIVQQRLFNTKLRLYFAVGLTTLVDLLLTVILLANGIFNVHMILSASMVALDGLLILAIIKSNFRFNYSRFIPLAYIVISLVVGIAIVPMLGTGMFTNIAFLASLIMHVVSALALFVCVFDAGRLGKKLTVIAVLLIIAFSAVSVGYCAMTITKGYYGQGGFGYRSLVYELDSEADGYKVVDIVDGNAQRVVIPNEYNGKQVCAVDCSIFTDEVLTNVDFECATDVKLLSVSELSNKNDNIAINIHKDKIDEFKEEIVELFEETEDATERENYVKLFNSIVPNNLAEDEVYITFDYTVQSLIDAEYEFIETWIGKKGSNGTTFNLASHTDVEYVEGYDLNSEEFLRYSYDNFNGRVMQTIQNGNTILEGSKLNSSASNVTITFENVYRITIGEDNDTMYESPNTFKKHADTDYRYLLGSDNANILRDIPARQGFTVKWDYSLEGESEKNGLTTLSSVVSDGMTVYPVWTLNAPVITELKSDKTDNLHIYGDNINLSTLATAPNDGVVLSYEWISEDIDQGIDKTQSSLTLTNVKPEKSGVYQIKVTASSTTSTSLTSTATKTINVTVNKKPLGFTWTLPDAVYSGTNKNILCDHVSADVINGDTITKTLNLDSVREVGDYNFEVSLTGACAELYVVKSENKTNSITIAPYEKEVAWVGSAYIYNGQYQGPTATLAGIGSDSSIDVTVTGQQKDSNATTGTQKYTAEVTTTNKNYIITNKTRDFTISKKAITFAWSNTEYEYDGENHNPIATPSGVESGDNIGLTYSTAKKNYSAEPYTCTISISNQNYEIATGYDSHAFVINQREINLVWAGNSFVYNGQNQHSTATGDRVVTGDVVTFTYENGENKNKGNYTVSATAVNNENYKFVQGATLSNSYEITARPLTITWSNNSIVYSAEEQKPTETIKNAVSGDDLQITYSNKYVNVGTDYGFEIYVGNTNYFIETGATTTYSITKKALTLTWSSANFVFNATVQYPTATANGICGSDVVNISYADYGMDAGTHTVTASIDNNNYSITNSTKSKQYSIEQYGVVITWSNLTFTYDKTSKLPTATTAGINESIIVTVNGAQTNAGTYTATADISAYTNYKIATNPTQTFTINQKELTLTWSSVKEFTYNAQNQYPTVTLTGIISGDTVNAEYVGYGKNAGSQTVNLSRLSNDNYKIASTEDTSCNYVINPKVLSYAWGNTLHVYSGNSFKPSITFDGFVGGETASDLSVDYGTANTNVGNYTCVVNFTNGNYTFISGDTIKTVSIGYEIVTATVSVVWSNISLVYNGNPQKPTATATGVKGETIVLNFGEYDTNVNVGDYDITVSTTNANYTLENVTKSYNITKKSITLTWANTSLVYNGQSQLPIATINGLVTGDDVITLITGLQTDVGTYNAECTLDGSDANNYKITSGYETKQFKITEAVLTVTFDTVSTFTYDGTAKEYGATITGFMDGDEALVDISYKYELNNQEVDPINAGNYSVTISITGVKAGNYRLSKTKALFTINKKTVRFTYPSEKTFEYNGSAIELEAVLVEGLVGSDTVTYTYYKSGSSTPLSGAPTEVGSYTVKATVTNASNYNLSGANANFTITAVQTND